MMRLPSYLLRRRQIVMILLASLPLIPAEAANFVVTTASDTSDPGDNLISLREALALANSDPGADTITFSDGTGGTVNFHDDQPETIVLGGTELLAFTQMSIIGPGADKLAISGDNRSRIFQFGGDYSVKSVSGLSILNGRTSTSIGLNNGGGILLFGGELTLTGCAISGNTAASAGGGIYVTYGGKLTLVRSNVSGNTARFGGGIYTWANDVSDSVTLTLVQCTVSGNSATFRDGGGIHSFGGGILRGNKFTMSQSTVSGNTAERTGGGIFTGGAAVKISQSTVSGNIARAREAGGAATSTPVAGGLYASTCTLDLENCIIADSTGADFAQSSVTLNLKGKNLIEDISIPAGPNTINSDPKLGPLQNNGGTTFTHALLPGSPAINAADNAPIPTDTNDIDGDRDITEPLPFDQRGIGFPRVAETLDIGAFEQQKSVLITADAASKAEGTGTGKTAFHFTVSRIVSSAGDVTMDYVVSGSAVNAADFGGSLPSGTVTIPDGNANTTLIIEVNQDGTPEANEEFTVNLANPNNGYVVFGTGATSTIIDDDTAVVSIAAIDPNADENSAGTGTWRISRSGSLAATTLQMSIHASSTAKAADWTQTGAIFPTLDAGGTGTVTIPAGATSVDVVLIPIDDIHAEAAETVQLGITAGTGYVISGSPFSTITIGTNDFVVINTNDAGEGTLRQAILNSNNLPGAETITFEGDVFIDDTLPDIIDIASMLPSFGDRTTVAGPGEDKLIIRRPAAAASFGMMQLFGGANVTLSGLTLTGGGGGIANLGNLRVDRCTISGNSSSTYGGILNNGSLIVSNSTISNNNSTNGVGGGIYSLGRSNLTVVNSSLIGNSSRNAGGGIAIVSNSNVNIMNSTISGNSAQSSGAGISNSGILSVTNCTITGNTGTGSGGGIATFIGSKLVLANSIVAGNRSSSNNDIGTFSSSNPISSNGANFIGEKTGVPGSTSTDMSFISTGTSLAELIGPLANNGGTTLTHRLSARSPAIDRGDNSAVPLDTIDLDGDSNTAEPLPFDQRGAGFDRLLGVVVDIGSFEGPAPLPPTVVQVGDKGILNTQTGLFDLTVLVTNTTPRSINGFRLHLNIASYLAAHPSLRLYNASNPPGSPDVYVDHPYPVGLDEVVSMKLSFHTSTRALPNPFVPGLSVEILGSSQIPDTNGSGVQLRKITMQDGAMLLEFPSVPGRWYRVRYSADMIHWQDCPVPLQAAGTRMQWIDSGPPFTHVPPSEAPNRFYVVNEIITP